MLTRKKNVLIRFREFFKSLEDQEQRELWDVLTALRGDDLESNLPVKIFTTGRIRGELFRVYHRENMPFGAYIIPTYSRARSIVENVTLQDLKRYFLEASSHFKQHTYKAIKVIVKYSPSRARDLRKFIPWIRW